jgi:SAM-dependent methyltransferase
VRERWALELEARARAHWTDARTDELLRGKVVAVRPREGAVLLRALGLMNADASLPPATVHKYFQVNHLVATLARGLDDLRARHPVVRVVDAGCGRSYLTTVLAWCGANVWDHPIEVLGVDRNRDVIDEGARRAALAGLGARVRFAPISLEQLAAERDRWLDGDVHAVIALHACDTATCDAIALGVGVAAELIAVAPCCQAELARGWAGLAERAGADADADADADGEVAGTAPHAFAPLWHSPHLRRETGAHVTDLMRALLMRAAGYRVVAMEFVPDEHTRKNTLLRAHRAAPDPAAAAAYAALVDATGGVGLALAARIGFEGANGRSCGK